MQAKISIYFIDTPLRFGEAVVFLKEGDNANAYAPMQYTLFDVIDIEVPDDVASSIPWRHPFMGSLRRKK